LFGGISSLVLHFQEKFAEDVAAIYSAREASSGLL